MARRLKRALGTKREEEASIKGGGGGRGRERIDRYTVMGLKPCRTSVCCGLLYSSHPVNSALEN